MKCKYPCFTGYGGVGMIGGNQFFLEDEDSSYILDFGIPFKTRGNFFEEFLSPRVGSGLEDYLKTGLVPHLPGIYREDLLKIHQLIRGEGSIPAHQEVTYPRVLLSHAHLDHGGYIPLLDPRITLTLSEMSLAILKVYNTTGKTGIESQYFEVSLREESGSRDKKDPKIARNLQIFTTANPMVDDGRVMGFPVDHSLPGASAFIIRSSRGLIIYSGDFRAHGNKAIDTWNFVAEVEKLKARGEKVRALLIEGTTLQRKGQELNYTENDVLESFCTLFKTHRKGFIFVDFGPRNLERLLITVQAAREAGRTVLLRLPDAFLLQEARKVDRSILGPEYPQFKILKERRASLRPWEKNLFADYPEQIVDPFEVRKEPDKYVVLFSFFDINEGNDFNFKGGTYIYSSSEAYTEEQRIDFLRLRNWLKLYDMNFIGDPASKNPLLPLHVTGHAYPQTIKEIINRIEPEILVPIHCEKPRKFREIASHSQIKYPRYGKTLSL